MRASNRSIVEGILLTDQYQLTMAQLYHRMGLHERVAQFDYFFRSYPDYGSHQAGYCVAAGLEWLLDWMHEAHFQDVDIAHLRSQTGRTGERTFDDDFLNWLRVNGTFSAITMCAIPVPYANDIFVVPIMSTSCLNESIDRSSWFICPRNPTSPSLANSVTWPVFSMFSWRWNCKPSDCAARSADSISSSENESPQ